MRVRHKITDRWGTALDRHHHYQTPRYDLIKVIWDNGTVSWVSPSSLIFRVPARIA